VRKDWQTIELCDRFFDAIEQKDYDTLESCYAPEAIVWHSHDCRYQPRADNLAMLKRGMETLPKTRFKDRRVRAFEGGFVQQHTIHVTREDGFVESWGLFRRVRARRDDQPGVQYFDTGQIEKFIGPRTEAAWRTPTPTSTSASWWQYGLALPALGGVYLVAADFKIPGGSRMWQFACGPCTVKLVTHERTPASANPPGGSRGGTGLRYWTMGVDDIEAAVAKCEAAGAPIPLGVTQLVPGIRIAMIEDPEGNVVEFLESRPLKMTRDAGRGLVERVRGVTPLIASTSFEAEAQRRPLGAVIEALKATGVFRRVRALLRRLQIDMSTYVDIGLVVAHADPSMGWVTTFYMEHNWLLTLFAEELQDEIFGASRSCSRRAPSTRAARVLGTTGRTPVGDTGGSPRASARGLGAAQRQGRRRRDRHGAQFLVTVDDVVVKDTWYVDGMVATGSHDVVATEVTVPARRVSSHRRRTSSLARRPVPPSYPDHAVPVAHRRDPRRRRRDAGARALRGSGLRPSSVRHAPNPEQPGADTGPPREPPRGGRLRRNAPARHRIAHPGAR
jgi:hypothetical protein